MKIARIAVAAAVWVLAVSSPAAAAEVRPGLVTCRLQGVEHDVLCGSVRRALDPSKPEGVQIEVRFAVMPALARNRRPDPVLFFAGGPGQSAIDIAGFAERLLARLGNRRDIVLIDQRGTGRSAPLQCEAEPATRALAQSADTSQAVARLRACRAKLQQLPHGDLRQYTTTIAMQDADAVRRALGAAQVNVIGGSYGTRAALEYMRQFPQAVRRAAIDGVAPPDMVLPAASSTDNQAALDALLTACAREAACVAHHPALAADWQRLLASLPRAVTVTHPVTGRIETFTLTRDGLLGLVRQPLYATVLASALPLAISQAAAGRFEALLGLASGLAGNRGARLAEGMHFSVVCAEDLPRLEQTGAAIDRPGADFGDGFATMYRQVCAGWPRGEVPAGFYTVPAARTATLVLSGGADPVTPSRHGERVARALGAQARHVVVPQAGHGVMAIGCMRDVLFRFIDAETDALALAVDANCARAIPRPGTFVPVSAQAAR